MSFGFVDISNLKLPEDYHSRDIDLTIVDDDNIRLTFFGLTDGKRNSRVFAFSRKNSRKGVRTILLRNCLDLAQEETGVEPRFRWHLHVPTLVPNPGSPAVTQEYLPRRESDALPALGLSSVMLDRKICLLKIRVSEFNHGA